MHITTGRAVLIALITSMGAASAARAGVLVPNKAPDKPLKLRKEQIRVRVSNQVLQATVNQVFENQTGAPVEATYLFKPPAGAAVSGFAHWVKGRKVESRVQEKREARKTYERARKAGAHAALLSQLRKGAFSMRVASIGAGKTRRVELRYEGILNYRAGTVHLHLPLEAPGKLAALDRGQLELTVDIRDSKEITAVRSASLPVKTRRIGSKHWRVTYALSDAAPRQDLRLQYDVRSRDIGLTFLTHRTSGQDGYFMLLAAPQELTSDRDIVKKDVVFVFDVSGSMAGDKIAQARGALKACLGFMNRGDRFGIVAFSDATNPFRAALQPLEPAAVRRAEAFIDKLEPAGGTNIHLALTEGLKMLRDRSRPGVVVFLTDGRATTGVTGSEAILSAVKARNRSSRLFTFGVGADVNRSFLERLGKTNRGTVDFIKGGQNLERAVAAFYAKIARPVLSDLQLGFGGVTVAMTYPSVLPDLYKGSQLLLVGRYRGQAEARASLSGLLNGARKRFPFTASFPAETGDNAFLPRLWAKRRIDYLMSQMRMYGDSSESRAEVIRLAKRYHIATPYTSLVATGPRPRLASLSPARIKPGDPEIKIRAPRGARAVTVVFPFGVTKTARFEPDTDLWTVRFLIPRDTPDGSYVVRIVATLEDGSQRRFRVHYTVDTAAPKLKLALSGPVVPGATVTLTATQIITERDLEQAPGYRPSRARRLRRLYARMMADTRSVTARLPSGKLLRLEQLRPGVWRGAWQVPASLGGRAALELVAHDVAGNRAVTTHRLDVAR